MPSFKSAAALAAMVGVALATPIEKRGTFSLKQVQKGTYLKNGPASVVKTFNKYGKEAPSEVKAAAAAAATGEVTTEPGDEYDSLYLTPVTVGSVEMELDIDTGSADLWVFSTLLSSSEQSGHAVYDPTVSGTKLSGYTWSITYGDGSGAKGTVYADKVVVGGVTATSQAVEAATSVSSAFSSDTDNDGLLGLAFSTINTVSPKSQTTWFDTVASSLAEKLFAVTLKKGEAGSKSHKYTGDIAYVDVDDSNGFWEFAPSGYAVGDGSVVSASIDAIADTGTTLLYLPTAVVSAYYAQVSGAAYSALLGGYTFPCSATLPDFTLVIGGESRTVPGDYINYSPIIASRCYGGIQRDTGIGFSIVGDIFLKSQYVVFDQSTGSPRLGFAQQA
ncbi:putative aspartic endopeptidase pep1 protein [Neofusicoccum parvum]|uniref:Aspartic endopeptidase pep1 protein n=2 Tax=Neofusicoccum parvum TaxID=310453 RepID=A0ACB5S8U1_9PEZI|nr:putative aspartic endopeptidase pep1 protein [Neofusicoccum parvum UCRNP2]GME29219.1 putative aspartic endopeptidase pep1 protein [Neofusicoccum parvum]GME45057.1 putative aspartic endopeptidase pep1 protein [Neofusicoccum parvum]